MPENIVILGAGTGGTMTANLLAATLRSDIRRGDTSLTVVADTGAHVFQPASLDVAFKGAPPARSVRPERPLLKPEVRLVTDGATRIDTLRQSIVLESGDELPYDALVLATGAVARPDAMPGLTEASLNFHTGPENAAKIWEALRRFERGRIVVAISSVPYKCPPSPNEAVFMLDEHFRRRGMREKVEIRLVTPYPHAYPAAPIAGVIEPRLEQQGIEVTTFFNMESADPERKLITSLEGEEIPYDLLIAIPPHRGAPVITASGLGDAEGWIPTDKETNRVKGFRNVFAMGDATDIPISKSGVVAHLQAEVVAHNVLATLRGGDDFAFEGRINCPMEVGDRRALFISATYKDAPKPQRPNVVKYAMKRSFGRMYWRVLRGNMEPMFRVYFGRTSHPQRRDAGFGPAKDTPSNRV